MCVGEILLCLYVCIITYYAIMQSSHLYFIRDDTIDCGHEWGLPAIVLLFSEVGGKQKGCFFTSMIKMPT